MPQALRRQIEFLPHSVMWHRVGLKRLLSVAPIANKIYLFKSGNTPHGDLTCRQYCQMSCTCWDWWKRTVWLYQADGSLAEVIEVSKSVIFWLLPTFVTIETQNSTDTKDNCPIVFLIKKKISICVYLFSEYHTRIKLKIKISWNKDKK